MKVLRDLIKMAVAATMRFEVSMQHFWLSMEDCGFVFGWVVIRSAGAFMWKSTVRGCCAGGTGYGDLTRCLKHEKDMIFTNILC